jgi:hypothetical protein
MSVRSSTRRPRGSSANTILVPSGLQERPPAPVGEEYRASAGPPETGATLISMAVGEVSNVYAMRFPSGDHAGEPTGSGRKSRRFVPVGMPLTMLTSMR